MKVLLVWPKARTDPEWGGDLGAVAEPLALEYLAAGVCLDGHEARILDLRLRPDALEGELRGYRPDVVGVTAFSMHVRAALEVCRKAKALLPDVITVAGGHHATFLPEDFFEPQMDHVVIGEGVAPLRALLKRYTEGDRCVSGLQAVWSRAGAKFEFGGPAPKIELANLPVPDRKVTQADRPHYFIDWMKPVALMRSSVGCPYRCTFCSVWQIVDGRYYSRPVDQVVEEAAAIEEEFVFLVDDEAFIQRHRMLELAQALKRAGVRKRFFAYCRMDSLVRQREVVKAWTEVGLERLMMGIDAISENDLVEYNKGYNSAQIEAGLRVAEELGIEVLAQFVVNTNYTKRDFQKLARFVEHHRIRYPSFTVLTPLPGTELMTSFDRIVERQENGRPNWDLFDTQNAVTATYLPRDEFRREYRNLFRLFRGSYSQYLPYHSVPQRAVEHSVQG
ncbi:MAG: cobalamin-dependent protein [Bryobacterales bacterium]|nr:cobalamin-dependent protein [Bryobacterales bacterium]